MTNTSKQSNDSRLGMVDLLRGSAALFVVWFHATANLPGEGTLELSSKRLGDVGVFIFFAISGFLIPYVLDRGGYSLRGGYLLFLLRRIARLDPPYLLSMLFAMAVAFASNLVPDYGGRPFAVTTRQVLLHFGYLNGIAGEPWLNGVFWTLSIEFQFYLLIGLVFPLLVCQRAWLRRATMAILLGLSLTPSPRMFLELSRSVSVLQYLPIFAAGLLAFQHFSRRIDTREYLLWAVVAGFAAGFRDDFLAAVIAGLLMTLARYNIGRIGAFLATISYSLYLTHVPIVRGAVHLGARVLPQNVLSDLVLVSVASAIAIGFAYAFCRVVEMPSIRWSRRIPRSLGGTFNITHDASLAVHSNVEQRVR